MKELEYAKLCQEYGDQFLKCRRVTPKTKLNKFAQCILEINALIVEANEMVEKYDE